MPNLLRALSVRQPWAAAITHLGKTIENRSWLTAHRGPLVIHAAGTWDRGAETAPALNNAYTRHTGNAPARGRLDRDDPLFPRGVLLAVVDVAGCHRAPGCTCSPWAMGGLWHWELANPRPLTAPVPASGRLGLWTLSPDLADAVRAALPERSKTRA